MRPEFKNFYDLAQAGYIKKWVILSVLIGIAAGFGSIIFYWSLTTATHLLLGQVAGYVPPAAGGEGATVFTGVARPWILPVLAAAGGLLSGIIVFHFAPEAEGHGTDAAIDAFHNKGGYIRRRVPLVKAMASAITIGSGGSAGREGPTAQIAAGIASALADLFHLSEADRRIAVATGIGAGIGSIFKAPLGGAILSMEVLYRRDFEYEALLPSFIASVVGYSIFASWSGWSPVFGGGIVSSFSRPMELVSYVILGVVCGLVGIVYGRSFYYLRDLFSRAEIPRWIKPGIGGFAVGLIGVFLPQALGTSYGWLQFAISGDFIALPVTVMLALVVMKILATGLTIGSGGSGGVFAPGLVIGGLTGGVVWHLLQGCSAIAITPSTSSAFVVVGMMALFGGIAKVPLAVILMVSEMTMDYTLLIPSMLACSIAYFVSGDNYIYEKQVNVRAESPAHRNEYSVMLLKGFKVRDALTEKVPVISSQMTVDDAANILKMHEVHAIPVVDVGRLVGIVAKQDAMKFIFHGQPDTPVRDMMSTDLIVTYLDESLFDAMNRMIVHQISQLPVVEREDQSKLLGLLSLNDITKIQCTANASLHSLQEHFG
ncbi:MAG: Inosine-5'-monophosphate dehydrogenase [Methanosaeta sp. PtaB.Bin018]|nr:MAG: Inosine-5'-monophosphate dehydrogenase [Methanosaeta sp. PtaB.Bin018]